MSTSEDNENKSLVDMFDGNIDLIVQRARHNEQMMTRFQTYEVELLNAETLRSLVEVVLVNGKRHFGLDTITMVLLDPDAELKRLLTMEGLALRKFPNLMFTRSLDVFEPLCLSEQPQLGVYEADRHARLFPQYPRIPASVAILPLVRFGRLVGSINFGSNQKDRYTPQLATDFLEHLGRIFAICIESTQNHSKLIRTALTDNLTSVHNRRFFDQRLGEEVNRAQRRCEPLSCLFMDIDFFKKVNDTYGHSVGDFVLADVAARITPQLRQCDVLARYGGEEFVALLPHTREGLATEVAERVRNTICETPIQLPDGRRLEITMSVGVASLMDDNNCTYSGEMLLKTADAALYQAKDTGRNKVVYFEQSQIMQDVV
ncbi:MAG: sensor domain-containing diguanylate cyclase [Methylococcales bacterium]|jgi:two-component system, cell cycle response regulator|nr:sensor domain-containing diguanylate cyclase [Methylococcales bacterium]MBT7445445.1 sensor domain-containing diguanylate cyclase [Methylococcales bacterium]